MLIILERGCESVLGESTCDNMCLIARFTCWLKSYNCLVLMFVSVFAFDLFAVVPCSLKYLLYIPPVIFRSGDITAVCEKEITIYYC